MKSLLDRSCQSRRNLNWNPIWVTGVLVCVLGCANGAAAQQQGVAGRIRPNAPAVSPGQGTPTNATASNSGSVAEGVLAETRKDYRIAPGDVIEIWVEDAPELSRNYRVNAAGEFPMSIVGRVAARAKTAEELGQAIATRLEAEEYLNKPNVVVTVRQYNSQTFIVQGSVNKPGIYQLETPPDMVTLIGLAGGLNENHGSTAFILRSKGRTAEDAPGEKPEPDANATKAGEMPGNTAASPATGLKPQSGGAEVEAPAADPSEKQYELIRVNLSALYKGHFEQNITLEPQDIINIPRIDVFFVAGEVVAPGSFPLKDGTTLRQAISLAQGMTFKAKAGQGVIFREDPDSGKRQELKVNIAAVMDGKQDDIAILPNDVVIVPNSRTKSISSALLNALGTNSARIPIRY